MDLHRLSYASTTLFCAIALALSTATASEKHDHGHEHEHEHEHENRQQGAHVHGIGQLNLALDGRELYIELDSPAANIVGFEYAPSSDADRAALDKAMAALSDGERLFRLTPAAGCRLGDAKIASALLDDHGHDEHKHDEHKHDDHKHDGHDHETHADIRATYQFACDNPGALDGVVVEVFEAFPGTERLQMQFVIGERQGAAELTPADHVVNF